MICGMIAVVCMTQPGVDRAMDDQRLAIDQTARLVARLDLTLIDMVDAGLVGSEMAGLDAIERGLARIDRKSVV